MTDCSFEKNYARKWKKCKIIVWRSANSCRIVENPKCKLKVCRTPNCLVFPIHSILFLHLFLSFHMSHRGLGGIWFLANYRNILELQINVKWDVEGHMAVCQNLVPLVNIKIAGKWMFIPLKMVSIGIDPYPYVCVPYYIPLYLLANRKLTPTSGLA